jgi:hypothetical protein
MKFLYLSFSTPTVNRLIIYVCSYS